MKLIRKSFLLFVILTTIIINTDCSGQSSKAERANKGMKNISYFY
jgi:hypothetical protein